MSEIRANTISAANGTDPVTLTKQSAAKAWCNFVGTGTPSISNSENVSSITDTATGKYSVNLSNSMTAADYSVVCMDTYYGLVMVDESALTASLYGLKTFNNSWSLIDPNDVFSTIHGDLA